MSRQVIGRLQKYLHLRLSFVKGYQFVNGLSYASNMYMYLSPVRERCILPVRRGFK